MKPECSDRVTLESSKRFHNVEYVQPDRHKAQKCRQEVSQAPPLLVLQPHQV
jgi:hypothetical protein